VSFASPDNFQPMNANFGLLPPLERKIRDKRKRFEVLSQRALERLNDFLKEMEK
jgi:methylenetetrahydrofolate--tRNA-(uracil-5-)-methyltransferase